MHETSHSAPDRDDRRHHLHPTSQPPPRSPDRPRRGHAPDNLRDVGLIAAILFGVVIVTAGIWIYQAREDGTDRSRKAAVAGRTQAGVPLAATHPRQAGPPPVRPVSVSPLSTRPPSTPRPTATAFDVRFELGGSRLSPRAKRLLDRQVRRMTRTQGLAVVIHGHTDMRGTRAANQVLGQRRAQAVRDYLIEAGIPKASIQVFSHGETGLLCQVDAESCHRKNRRVHVEWKAGGGPGTGSTPVTAPDTSAPRAVRSQAGATDPSGATATQPSAEGPPAAS